MIPLLNTENIGCDNLGNRFLMKVYTGYGTCQLDKFKDQDAKSIGHERTFENTSNITDLERICDHLCLKVEKSLLDSNLNPPKKVVIKLKLDDFEVINRTGHLSLSSCDGCSGALLRSSMQLIKLEHEKIKGKKVRLLGVRVTDFQEQGNLSRWLQLADKCVTCPICGERVLDDADNRSINQHIDSCLTSSLLEQEKIDTNRKRKYASEGILKYFKREKK